MGSKIRLFSVNEKRKKQSCNFARNGYKCTTQTIVIVSWNLGFKSTKSKYQTFQNRANEKAGKDQISFKTSSASTL